MSKSTSPTPEPVQLPAELEKLVDYVETKPESFATGAEDIRWAALGATKWLFDRAVRSEASAAPSIDDLLKGIELPSRPVTRSGQSQQLNDISKPKFSATPLESLVLNGMGPDQIWEQLELRNKTICTVLDAIVERDVDDDDDDEEEEEAKEDGAPDGFDRMDLDVSDEEEDSEEEEEESDGMDEDLGEDVVQLRDDEVQKLPVWSGPRHPTLDDGFFSIDRFNRETELLEAKTKGSGKLGKDDEGDEELEEEIDLFAPLDEDDEDDEEEGGFAEDGSDEDELEGGEEDDSEEVEGDSQKLNGALRTEGVDEILYDDFFRLPYRFAEGYKQHSTSTNAKASSSKPRATVRFAESVRVKTIKARGKGRNLMEDDDDEEEEEEGLGGGFGAFGNGFGGGIFSDPRLMTGPGGFGGFAPRAPVAEVIGQPSGEEDFPGFEDMDKMEDSEDGSEDMGEDDFDDEDEGDEDNESEDGIGEDVNDQGREAIERLKDDIFAEPEVDEPPEPLSTHEKRLAAIAREIAALEDENVAEKPWLLKGEANAKRRPENSLLEADLEFEHTAKPVPIVTEETTKTLEDMIKARILEGRFDDVVRQRPMDAKAFLPRDVIELQDTQSKKCLAELYADDYTAASSSANKPKSTKLTQEHEELEKAWSDMCYKLDALSNAHFTPKMPKATMATLGNVASASLESALPTTMSTSALLAPQEVFAHDQRAAKAKSEMTPGEKRALRTKVKHARKNQQQVLSSAKVKFAGVGKERASAAAGLPKQPKNVKEAKEAALDMLVKTGKGVTVVGKPKLGTGAKGKAGASDVSGGGQFKL